MNDPREVSKEHLTLFQRQILFLEALEVTRTRSGCTGSKYGLITPSLEPSCSYSSANCALHGHGHTS